MRSNIRDCSLVINNIRVMFMFSLPKKCSSHWLLRAVCGIGTRSKGHRCAPSYLARKFLPKLFINVKCIPNRHLTKYARLWLSAHIGRWRPSYYNTQSQNRSRVAPWWLVRSGGPINPRDPRPSVIIPTISDQSATAVSRKVLSKHH